MIFKRQAPANILKPFIDCYWVIDDEDTQVKLQPIIPDGFTEIIFDYRNPYRIKLEGDSWRVQPPFNLAGQLRSHFVLENCGASGMIAIKFRPTALTHLFRLNMKEYTDRVADLHDCVPQLVKDLAPAMQADQPMERKFAILDEYFGLLIQKAQVNLLPVDRAVELIFTEHGMITVQELASRVYVSERQLENQFSRYVGLSPKFFSRVIRFNYIFELLDQTKNTWTSLAYEAAYFDQSHFIREFRAFTGKNPAAYGFDEKNMANFFLRKTAD